MWCVLCNATFSTMCDARLACSSTVGSLTFVAATMALDGSCVRDTPDVNGLDPIFEPGLTSHWTQGQQLGSGHFSHVYLSARCGEKRASKVISKQRFLEFRAKSQSPLFLHDEPHLLKSPDPVSYTHLTLPTSDLV